MENIKKIFTREFFLTAGECDARGEMPMTLLAERIIEVASNHANRLGIGYADLTPHGVGWVLTRMGIEMRRTPRINQLYSISTWVENWNRAFSERCFRFLDGQGNIIGEARTIWAIIDFETRRAVDLTKYGTADLATDEQKCEMPRLRKHLPVQSDEVHHLKFRFMDLDFNRHVNSVRYIEHILNLWPLSHYDQYRIDRFDIAYRHECLAGQEVQLVADKSDALNAAVDIVREGERVVTASLRFVNSPFIPPTTT